MGFGIGPSSSWMRTKEAADYYAIRCPVATTLGDGSRIFCKTGGRAWVVAPSSTQVGSQWAGGQYNSSLCGVRCCIFEWLGVCIALLNNGFNPCDWFIPTLSQLQSGYNCRANWDTFTSSCYWSSTEDLTIAGCYVSFISGTSLCCSKSYLHCVRSIRCVTY